jgi:AraC-like DNA-binding protein
MHPWFGISLVRSPAVVSLEARREVVIDRHSIVLIPGFHLFGLRPRGEAPDPAVTLLLGGSHLEGLGFSAQAALVTDAALGEEVAALVTQWRRPLRSVEHASTIRSMLERLAARGTPLAARRPRRISLDRVRDYLRAQVNQPVSVEELARLSGLSASYLVRTFHYEFGLPPHAYHLRVRLAAACKLLTLGRAIASVAYECGFADQSHLSRRFKAVYGVTPAAWTAASAGYSPC